MAVRTDRIIIALAVISIATTIVAFVLTQWFHLPLTPYLLPGNIIGAVIIVSNKWTISKALQWHSESILPAFVACASIILPTILATCAGIYGLDNDIVSGQIESSWTRLFRSKDESTIHGIQSSLHCCGLHSTKDRAAPFPDKDTDAHACERESGYLIPCAPAWQRHLTIAASLHLVASVMLSIAALLMIQRFVFLKRSVFAPDPGERTRLLQADYDDMQRYSESIRTAEHSQSPQAGPSN